MGNRGQFRAALRWCAVAAGREGLEIRTAMSAALDRGAIGIRLSPAARDLSPPAKTCHDLPRCVSFSGDAWRSARLRKNEVRKGFVPISRMDQKLWHIDESKRAEIRSVSSDLFLENGVEGIQGPVTACHISVQNWRREEPAHKKGSLRSLFPKPCRGDLGRDAAPRPTLWRAAAGLGGTFRKLFPRRCPGQQSTAPLVLRRKNCGRRFGGVGGLLRTAPNGGPLDSIKATDWQRKPTGRRHLTTTDDRIGASKRKQAAMFYGAGDGRHFKEILLKKIIRRDLRRLVVGRCLAQSIPAS